LYGKRNDKLLREEIEKQINKEAHIDFSAFQIEHILPQTNGDAKNLSENRKNMLGPLLNDKLHPLCKSITS
jgi:hypothetical protein